MQSKVWQSDPVGHSEVLLNITRSNSAGLTNNITVHVALIVFILWYC